MIKFFVKDLNDVDEAYRAMYRKCEGGYQLDVNADDIPDVQRLKRNKDEILEEKRAEQEKRRKAEEELAAKQHDEEKAKAQTREEFEKLLDKERERNAAKASELQAKLDATSSQLKDTLVKSTIDTLAVELAGEDAELIKPHIAARIGVEEVDGKMKISIKGKDGQASTLTVEQLGSEFRGDKMFASVITGRSSSGAGTASKGAGFGASENEKFFDPKSPDFSITKQIELEDSNPTLYKELSDKFNV